MTRILNPSPLAAFLLINTVRGLKSIHVSYVSQISRTDLSYSCVKPSASVTHLQSVPRDANDDNWLNTTDSNDDYDDLNSTSHGSNNNDKALHELEHRAKHAGVVEGSKLVAETVMRTIESLERVGRVGEMAAERLGERASERLAERAGERIVERSGERIAERAGERLAERAGERLAERTGERLAERAGERLAERTGERLASQAGERLALGRSIGRLWERLVGKSGRAVKGGLTRTAERAGERALERSGERAVVQSVGTGVVALERRALSVSGRRLLVRRLGRAALIVVPALGGLFAVYLLRSDLERAQQEWKRAKSELVWLAFLCAAFADGLDTIVHFVIAFGLLWSHHHHHLHMHLLESVSVGCAIGSTVFAVGGEAWSQLRSRRSNGEPLGSSEPTSTLSPLLDSSSNNATSASS